MFKLTSLRVAAVALVILSVCTLAPAQERRDEEQKPARLKSDWTFPTPGMKSQYSEQLKTTIYNLGHGFHAARVKLEGMMFVFVALPEGSGRIPDSDLALVVASKTLLLPRQGEDAVLEKENEYEHRFRTVGGRVASVTLAHDRKTAIVRIIPLESDGLVY